ncbi:MAG: aminotransferase class I/II-fold pyridoxal phosphate-dependent enzyme [Acidobacteriota bacterium]
MHDSTRSAPDSPAPAAARPPSAVPFIDLQRFEDGFLDRWAERVAAATAETRFVGGPAVTRFEQHLASRCGVAHAIGCANGTDALQLALRAAGVGPSDLVVIPEATFWATFEAVVNVGARVVTVDVDPEDLQLDVDLLVRALELHRPRAVILVHLYGWTSARLTEVRSLCAERGVTLIEDGAQAIAVEIEERPIFADAEIATLSFYPAKVLGACGDAGAVLCHDEDLAERVRQLGNHGRTAHYGHGSIGWNSRLGGLEAEYLDLALEQLDGRLASRRRAAARYRERFADTEIRCMAPPAGVLENGYLNVTLHEPTLRDAIESGLRSRGIGVGKVYPGRMSTQPGAGSWLASALGGEHAERLCRGVLNLPLFAHIRDEEVDAAADALLASVADL